MTFGFLLSLFAIVAVGFAVYRVFAFLREDVGVCARPQNPAPETGSLPPVALQASSR